MPILGILASSKFISAGGDYESIATVTVGSGGAANVEFTSIPSGFAHLQVRAIARSTRAQTTDAISVRANGDSGSNYATHYLFGNGSSASAGAATSQTFGYAGGSIAAASATASVFGVLVLDILDYTNTNKYTTFRTLGGFDNNGSGAVELDSTVWMNSNAITSLTFLAQGGSANFAQYSHFALYGIKSA